MPKTTLLITQAPKTKDAGMVQGQFIFDFYKTGCKTLANNINYLLVCHFKRKLLYIA